MLKIYMHGTDINKYGKQEKNKKVKEGECIFPFTYKWKEHNECIENNEKGNICATSVTDRGTLKTYGYCHSKQKSPNSIKKGTKKKALNTTIKKRKLKIVDRFPSKSKSSVITEKNEFKKS